MQDKTIYNIVHARSGANGKTHWQRCGVLIHNPDKPHAFSIHLDAIPTGEWDGWLSCFIKADDDPRANGRNQQTRQDDEGDYDAIPFD